MFSFAAEGVVLRLCSPHCPGTWAVDRTVFELIEIHLPLPPCAGIKGICHHQPVKMSNFLSKHCIYLSKHYMYNVQKMK